MTCHVEAELLIESHVKPLGLAPSFLVDHEFHKAAHCLVEEQEECFSSVEF